ncbi:MAG: hypothetical protein R3281_12940 [Balneolaceae bacterium]|nr:hypothetical protein [Balneolaceae bacterium]
MFYLLAENWFLTLWESISTNDVTLISSVVIAIATVVYAVLTHQLVKLNSSAIEERLRPYVIVNLPLMDRSLDLVIKNIGERPAPQCDSGYNTGS